MDRKAPPIWGNQHVNLLDAIRDHDAAAAAAATTAHLVSSMLNALNALADEAVVSRITRLAEWACPTAVRGDPTDPQGCPDRGDGARRAGSRA